MRVSSACRVVLRRTDEWYNFLEMSVTSAARSELAVLYLRALWHYDRQTNGIIFLQFVCPSLVLQDIAAHQIRCTPTDWRRNSILNSNGSHQPTLHKHHVHHGAWIHRPVLFPWLPTTTNSTTHTSVTTTSTAPNENIERCAISGATDFGTRGISREY